MLSTHPLGDAASYFIRAGYGSRDSVEYFADKTDEATVRAPTSIPTPPRAPNNSAATH